jgi:hypothetical protein
LNQLLTLPENKQQEIQDLNNEFYNAEDRGLCLADLFDAYVLSHAQHERSSNPPKTEQRQEAFQQISRLSAVAC